MTKKTTIKKCLKLIIKALPSMEKKIMKAFGFMHDYYSTSRLNIKRINDHMKITCRRLAEVEKALNKIKENTEFSKSGNKSLEQSALHLRQLKGSMEKLENIIIKEKSKLVNKRI